LGEARGASFGCCGRGGPGIFEVAPRKVKQAIVVTAQHKKRPSQKWFSRMLRVGGNRPARPADALGAGAYSCQEIPGSAHSPKGYDYVSARKLIDAVADAGRLLKLTGSDMSG